MTRTLEELKKMPLQYTFGMRFDDRAVRQYQNQTLGICKQVTTMFNKKTHKWGRPKIEFINIKTGRQFTKLEDLLLDLNSSSNNT